MCCTPSPTPRARRCATKAERFLVSRALPGVRRQRLRPEALAVTFAGRTIAELAGAAADELAELAGPAAAGDGDGPRR